VVFDKEDIPLIIQFLANEVGDPKLLFQPQWNGLYKRGERSWEGGNVGIKDPLEFQEGFVVKADVIELFGSDSPLTQAIIDGVGGKVEVMFFPREAFLRGRCDDVAVPYETGRGIVIKTRYSQNVHNVSDPVQFVRFFLGERNFVSKLVFILILFVCRMFLVFPVRFDLYQPLVQEVLS
jgi:hypothetical protein